MALRPQHFAAVNIALCVVWLAIVVGVAREHRRLTDDARLPAGVPQPAEG